MGGSLALLHSRDQDLLPHVVSSFKMFGGPTPLDEGDWDVMTSAAPVKTLIKGDYLIRQGFPNQYIFRYATIAEALTHSLADSLSNNAHTHSLSLSVSESRVARFEW